MSDAGHTTPGVEPPEEVLEILGDLEQALSDHVEWLKEWHLAVVCRLEPSADCLDIEGFRVTGFGKWYYVARERLSAVSPSFAVLGEGYEAMHDHARVVARSVGEKSAVPVNDYDLFMNSVLAFNHQVQRVQHELWNRFANTDPLTGVRNRAAMLSELDVERERSRRTGQHCCICIADLDHFKNVNDTYGHLAGDKVLKVVSGVLAKGLRPYDQIFRYGGEEFLLCLPDTETDAAFRVLERLRQAVEETVVPLGKGTDLTVTVSFGIAAIDPERGVDASVEQADRALYAAKAGGRNQGRIWPVDGTTT